MGALFTVSYWIALVTVIPGFITIAAVSGGVLFVNATGLGGIAAQLAVINDWIFVAAAITLMILTQAGGILLEELLVSRRWLGKDGIPPHNISRYEEYSNLYFLLARMEVDDDAHGHLRRAVAQFFLTLNTLISFGAGVLAAWGATVIPALTSSAAGVQGTLSMRAGFYTLIMIGCLTLSYPVAVIRFREMARSVWAVRKLTDLKRNEVAAGEPDQSQN